MLTMLALGLAMFALSVVYNYTAARCVIACARSERLRAANTDLVLGVVGLVALWAYVEIGWWTAIPELAGGWLGTFYGAGLRAQSGS